MRNCVEILRKRGWPPVFAFSMTFWAMSRTPTVLSLLATALGDGFSQDANIWVYYVLPGGSGRPPHLDSADPNGKRLTIWIPLTEVRVEGGCIYVIARNKVPKSLPSNYMTWETLRCEEFRSLMQGVKAMPSPARSVLGWDQFVIHWGSKLADTAPTRISLAVEFIAANASAREDELPLIDPKRLPSFSQRLHLVGKSLIEYKRFELLSGRFASLAEKLISIGSN